LSFILTDVNILVEAVLPNAPRQREVQRWLIDRLVGKEPFGVYEPVLASVIRVVTLPPFGATPRSLDYTIQFAEGIRRAPSARPAIPTANHWHVFRRLLEEQAVVGKRVSDAYLAALAIDLDATFYSFDKGFANFPGLKWRLPEI
jgi:uncharacterized protein